MKAIILAAGRSKRLKDYIGDIPKSLIKIGSESLLERHISILNEFNVKEVIIIVGYLKEKIIENIGHKYKDTSIKYIDNQRFTEGNILSLYLGKEEMNDDLLVLDADVYCDKELLRKLIFSKNKNCLLMATNENYTGEEVLIVANKEKVEDLFFKTKVIGNFETIGENVGFAKICKEDASNLSKYLEYAIENNMTHLDWEEFALRNLIQNQNFGYELTENIPWIEIDFPHDVEKAKNEIYQKIKSI